MRVGIPDYLGDLPQCGLHLNASVHANQKSGEPRCADALRGQFECARATASRSTTLRTSFQANGWKEPRHGLKLMNAAAKMCSIGFEKNKVASLRDCSNQMRNAGMKQRLYSCNPNDRRATGNNLADPFVGNRMAGIGMQNFCDIHKLAEAATLGLTRLLPVPAPYQCPGKPPGEPTPPLETP